MLFRIAITILLMTSSSTVHHHSLFKLPPDAHLTIGHSVIGPDKESVEGFCENWKLSENEVRKMFATYHLLKDDELHDFYLFPDCWIDGTIIFHGRTFQWRARLGNTLSTDWPDGKTRILGGKHSQDPSGGDAGNQ